MPGMAFQDAFNGEPGAIECAMGGDSFHCIVRAGRIEAALSTEKRAQRNLIAADGKQEQTLHHNKYIC